MDRARAAQPPSDAAPPARPAAPTRPPTSVCVVDRDIPPEVDEYSSSVAGVELEAVRVGVPVSQSHVMAVTGGRFTFTRSQVGFPMLSRATIADDTVIIATVLRDGHGSRWCEIPLQTGHIVGYAPGAEHTARNLPGLGFLFVSCHVDQLQSHADQLGTTVEIPARGEVHLLADSPATALVRPAFTRFAALVERGHPPDLRRGDDVLRAMVHALADPRRRQRVGSTSRIDSRHIVHDCIEHAEAIGRIPSISELCAITHVSERRLREAFTEEYDLPPTRFFRAWALGEAHRRLAHSDPAAETVTHVAADLGFDHLGRFSGHYREIFDERPSDTLQNAY